MPQSFRLTERIPLPRDLCFRTLRDRQHLLVPHYDHVKEIRVLEREDLADGRVRMVNEWVSDYEVPGPVSRIIKPDMLRWLDIVTWDERSYAWDWRFDYPIFKGAVACAGRNCMLEPGPGATEIVLQGELTIRPEALPGVPGFIGRRVGPTVEKFILGIVTPGLRRVAEGLGKHLGGERA